MWPSGFADRVHGRVHFRTQPLGESCLWLQLQLPPSLLSPGSAPAKMLPGVCPCVWPVQGRMPLWLCPAWSWDCLHRIFVRQTRMGLFLEAGQVWPSGALLRGLPGCPRPGHRTEPLLEGAEVKPRPGPGEPVPVVGQRGSLLPLPLPPKRWPRRLLGGVRCRLGTGWVVWGLRGQSPGAGGLCCSFLVTVYGGGCVGLSQYV